MTLNPQKRVDDACNLNTELAPGRTVLDVVNERARLAEKAERARVAALDEAVSYTDAGILNRLARLFTAGHGR